MRNPSAISKGQVAFRTYILLPAGISQTGLRIQPLCHFLLGFLAGCVATFAYLLHFDGPIAPPDLDGVTTNFTGSCY